MSEGPFQIKGERGMDHCMIPVVTTKQLAEYYQCSSRTLIDHLFHNFEQFLGSFYVLTGKELAKFKTRYPQETNDCYEILLLWTVDGMYLHAKLLATAEAWGGYCHFVYHHFKQSKELQQAIGTILASPKVQ